ncbi:MAG: dephospho-CoA kinase [Kangiellaceae bacterium]|nr:dephospho-CoA kinase [Kangiellaceae bacterium]
MTLHIALTGGIASGKTAVSNMFSELGITVVDADIVARQVVEPGSTGLKAIRDYFGSSVINSDGTLDRPLLRSIVFEDELERQWLNNLLHPLIREQMALQRAQATSDYSISAIPLLFETQQSSHYDRILVVDCLPSTQIARLMARDNISEEQARNMLKSQATREQRLSIADDIIVNDSDLQSLQQQVIKLDKQYRQLAKSQL